MRGNGSTWQALLTLRLLGLGGRAIAPSVVSRNRQAGFCPSIPRRQPCPQAEIKERKKKEKTKKAQEKETKKSKKRELNKKKEKRKRKEKEKRKNNKRKKKQREKKEKERKNEIFFMIALQLNS